MKEANNSLLILGDLLCYLGLWLFISSCSGWRSDYFWSVTPLLHVWVMCPHPHPPFTVSMTEFLSFSNLYRLVGSEIILASLGSIRIHFFVADIFLYLSVALLVRCDSKTSVPLYKSSFVLSMKRLKIEFGHENRALNKWWTSLSLRYCYVIRYQYLWCNWKTFHQ